MTIFLRSFLTFWIATVLIISISFGLVLMTHHLNRVPPVSVPLRISGLVCKRLSKREVPPDLRRRRNNAARASWIRPELNCSHLMIP